MGASGVPVVIRLALDVLKEGFDVLILVSKTPLEQLNITIVEQLRAKAVSHVELAESECGLAATPCASFTATVGSWRVTVSLLIGVMLTMADTVEDRNVMYCLNGTGCWRGNRVL